MTAFIAALDATLGTLGATIVIVHHTPLSRRERPRGSTALLGALDGVFMVAKDDDATTVTTWRAGDQRDTASRDHAFAFQLIGQPIPGAVDNVGNPVTAVVAEPTEAAAKVVEPTGKNQRLAMSILRQMYAEGDTQRVTLKEWRERFIDETSSSNPRDAWSTVKTAAANSPWWILDGPFAYPPELYRSDKP